MPSPAESLPLDTPSSETHHMLCYCHHPLDQTLLDYKSIPTADFVPVSLSSSTVRGSVAKKIHLQLRRHRTPGFDPRVGKIPWRKKWQSAPVFLPGKSHGQRSLAGCRPKGHKESGTTERPSVGHRASKCLLTCPLTEWQMSLGGQYMRAMNSQDRSFTGGSFLLRPLPLSADRPPAEQQGFPPDTSGGRDSGPPSVSPPSTAVQTRTPPTPSTPDHSPCPS